MSMNTRDQRLYHYEYRRPRISNPTYNSSHVFESLNMLARIDNNASQLGSYGRYSLSNNKSMMSNPGQLANSNMRLSQNYSMNLSPNPIKKQTKLLNEKDSLYLQMIDERNRSRANRNNYDGMNSRMSQNAENSARFNPKADSLSKELKQFDSHRK